MSYADCVQTANAVNWPLKNIKEQKAVYSGALKRFINKGIWLKWNLLLRGISCSKTTNQLRSTYYMLDAYYNFIWEYSRLMERYIYLKFQSIIFYMINKRNILLYLTVIHLFLIYRKYNFLKIGAVIITNQISPILPVSFVN